MNFQDLILTIYTENSEQCRKQKIQNMSKQILQQLHNLDQIEKSHNQHEQKHLFEAFFKVIEKISVQIRQVKQKYQAIDKEELKFQKCLKLGKDLKIFKEECFYLRDRIAQKKKQLKNVIIENELLQQEHKFMQNVYQRKSEEKDQLKFKTSAIAFGGKNIQNKEHWFQQRRQQRQHVNRRTFMSLNIQTQIQKRKRNNSRGRGLLYLYDSHKYTKSRNNVRDDQKSKDSIQKRLISTSQQPRKSMGHVNNEIMNKAWNTKTNTNNSQINKEITNGDEIRTRKASDQRQLKSRKYLSLKKKNMTVIIDNI